MWQTAWFCLAPLLFILSLEQSLFKAFVYGFLFGLAYNCVYWQWLLHLAPLDWLGFNAWQGQLMSWAALFFVAAHQAFIVAIFAFAYRLLIGSSLVYGVHIGANRGVLTQMLLVPLLWTLIVNKLGNAHNLLGVPWSMLEYSQYKNLYIIQIADIIGGIGIGCLLVMINTLIAQVLLSIYSSKFKVLAILPSVLLGAAVVAGVDYYGHNCLNFHAEPREPVSIVQPNINIAMYKTQGKYSVEQLLSLETSLSQQCQSGLCVWTEGALPIHQADNSALVDSLKYFITSKQISLVLGTFDQDKQGNFYNAAWAISAQNPAASNYYHKRYLVPFGEYTPSFVDYLPYSQTIRTLTNTPAGTGYACGSSATVLKLDSHLLAPLICFEVIAPELAAAGVRDGGQLLVNINDLSWFHQSIIGEQMIACAVFRAIENRRYFIFAANTGPSAIISPRGEIQASVGQNVATVLAGKIDYLSDLTPFTRWCMF